MKTVTNGIAHTGLVLHGARFYDFVVWALTLGREKSFRDAMILLAHLQTGERVLDIGCGTGGLALRAKSYVGAAGVVNGIDASPEMIERATAKARKAGVDATFAVAPAQALPFPEAQFDVVFSTLMLHHLPRPARREMAIEARRVLKPGGRLLIVDFGKSTQRGHGPLRHLQRHGGVPLNEIHQLLTETGFTVRESGPVGMKDLQFALATVS